MGWCQMNGGELFAHAFHPGVATTNKKRHVGAQTQAHFGELVARQVQTPQAVECQQGAGGVGRSPAQAGFSRQAFGQSDVHAVRTACGLLQGLRGAHAQVVFGQNTRGVIVAHDPLVGAQVKVQRIGPVDEHKNGLQQVVAVFAPPSHVQKQVQLGGCRYVVQVAQRGSGGV